MLSDFRLGTWSRWLGCPTTPFHQFIYSPSVLEQEMFLLPLAQMPCIHWTRHRTTMFSPNDLEARLGDLLNFVFGRKKEWGWSGTKQKLKFWIVDILEVIWWDETMQWNSVNVTCFRQTVNNYIWNNPHWVYLMLEKLLSAGRDFFFCPSILFFYGNL